MVGWLILPIAATIGAVFLIGGASGRRERHKAERLSPDVSALGEASSLQAVIRSVLDMELPQAATRFTALEMAVEPGLPVRWDEDALARALRFVVQDALGRAEGGRVLVTAGRHGGRVRVAVSDDGPAGDREMQEALLREPQQIFALMGATMEVEPQPGQGTTVVIRLPEPGPLRASLAEPQAAPATDRPVAARPALPATQG